MHLHLPPQVALLFTVAFMGFLFWRDIRAQRGVTGALWLPVLWLTIIGSRYVSQWLAIFGLHVGAVNVQDGSPVDSLVFGLLILAGVCVLYQRRVHLSEVIRNNRWMTLFLIYCFVAILWSDFPFAAFKRWLKVLGHPVMVLVVLTEPDVEEAITRLFKRCAFVWVPVSILFIKYFPQWGRTFSQWTGAAENTGIATDKNMLGLDLFIVGVFFFWYMLKIWRSDKGRERRDELILIGLFLGMTGWLLHISNSKTSLVSVIIGTAIMVFLGLRWVNPRFFVAYLLAFACVVISANWAFGLYDHIIRALGRNPTLTDRTLIWHHLLQLHTDPILGTGFESFWLWLHTRVSIADNWWAQVNEAHNAYLETYLNLGVVGLFLFVGWAVVAFRKAHHAMLNDFHWGQFRLALLLASLIYGWTEAAFRSLDPVYFTFFLIAMDYPRAQTVSRRQLAENEHLEEELETSEKETEPVPA